MSEVLDLSFGNCDPSSVISRYFPSVQNVDQNFVNQFLQIQDNLNECLSKNDFLKPPVKYIYNPTEYASKTNQIYIKKYCTGPKKILFIGMNPGPFGMCQTGVPFGDTYWVKNWLQIDGEVLKPLKECPNRPIFGFQCTRKEQSGDRFWNLFSELCTDPEKFFNCAFVYNYCPLAFMDGTGRNLTPADIKERKNLELICDKYYHEVLKLLQPEVIVAVGDYMEKRTKAVFKVYEFTNSIKLFRMPHPSPRAVNNQNWSEKAKRFLEQHNLMEFIL